MSPEFSFIVINCYRKLALSCTVVHCGSLWWVSGGSVEDELTGRQAAAQSPIGCRSGHLAPLVQLALSLSPALP